MADRLHDAMASALPDGARTLIERLNDAGHAAYVVGGFVRDVVLGRPTHDVDVATSASPEAVMRIFADRAVYPTGLKHGTVTVAIDGRMIEVTTFRADGDYTDGRHPDRVTFVDAIEEDLARRDVTINAVAWHPDRGFIDPWGGVEDMARGVIRAVGDPTVRFREDGLRLMRALRLASELSFSIEPATSEALMACRDGLARVAPERVLVELRRLLVGPAAPEVLASYAPVPAVVIPELDAVIRRGELDRAVRRMARLPADPALRLAGLLWDVADADRPIDEVARRLRSDRATVDRLQALRRAAATVDAAMHAYHPDPILWRAYRRDGAQAVRDAVTLIGADRASASAIGDTFEIIAWTAVKVKAHALLLRAARLEDEGLAVDGHDVEARGCRGPEIGAALDRLRYDVVTGKVKNEREALMGRLETFDLGSELTSDET